MKKKKILFWIILVISFLGAISFSWRQPYLSLNPLDLIALLIFSLSFLTVIITIPLVIIFLFLYLKSKKKQYKKILKTIATLLLLAIGYIATITIMSKIVDYANTFTARPIINAIEDYHKDYELYPQNISQLKPKYIDEIPNNLWNESYIYELFDFHEIYNPNTRRYDKINITKYRLKSYIGIGWYLQIYDSYGDHWFVVD
tara:strand:- start:2536 stop:3138 length:603 start_codon:yes stop_codon:yes gene_type:complete